MMLIYLGNINCLLIIIRKCRMHGSPAQPWAMRMGTGPDLRWLRPMEEWAVGFEGCRGEIWKQVSNFTVTLIPPFDVFG